MMYYYPFVAGPGELIAKGIARHDSPNIAMIQEAQDNPVKHATSIESLEFCLRLPSAGRQSRLINT